MPIDEFLAQAAFDAGTVALLTSAFDSAWQTIEKSGSPLAAEDQHAATREALAKHIIAVGKTGERDPQRIVDEALARLVGSR